MQSSRGHAGAPPSSSRFPWLGAGLALLATVVLVSGAPLVPEPTEFASTVSNSAADARAADIRALFADPTAWVPDARENGGWISHWLGGGEGILSISVDGENITLPHRPAAFPDWLGPSAQLPVTGILRPFTVLSTDSKEAPERACVTPKWPPTRPSYPVPPYTVALVERGGCDFATKVLAAQERGAAAVVVGDSAHPGETDEEGRMRENLITMFSPEDTSGIIIPSVFVSRASYLIIRDLLSNHTVKGKPGLEVEVGEASDDGSALGSLLTFALLMPSLFLIATVAAHRVRVARQREANRAPPTVVLSLPERVWSPDIVWEKDDSESDKDEASQRDDDDDAEPTPKAAGDSAEAAAEGAPEMTDATETHTVQGDSDVTTRSADADDEADAVMVTPVKALQARRRGKERRKSKRYYSKDECAICMDDFHKGEIVRILPCGHVFHKDECDEWLLKWRKLCPTCRADVTIPTTDLSGSTTITPVVDRTAAAAEGGPRYGATDEDGEDEGGARGTWTGRAGTRLGAMWNSLRAAVARPAPETGERAPLVPVNVV
ncbi:hypothetical protein CcaverHIS002_0201750 [Cutaneotrichosporon cavernicola]|uniref:RING-type E3 ubiquitin transferase n=1 Tax=Cutaneotrichosporon cavernicola TaxID=279322 RepID=A0AA48ID80_9TREE|nr:uncharacterized protein CcaverHIS019_0201780 [Cutaneotrichosporon cavernicola]BEI81015.1 hypothetical protein CcaverHIS002_0201750 [Cutaneotrichosporon cavernicola]BEI88816.1 hypothetical protein CcaverHIS019_0201780 [Cutaneotrichosporon cavernicola]BEI96591.1 hypothetical protein CcaverHIS631_0201800 [Cutaneotrichosporon cavernicola]BEJ04363.1 hypothetical protein CcaverHIS641_0201800 [Cutaneotrichosporon cavernicola]